MRYFSYESYTRNKEISLYSIIIVGGGKLANAILDNLTGLDTGSRRIKSVSRYRTDTETAEGSVFVHVGSGRQYEESLQEAIDKRCIYIQAATHKDIVMPPPGEGIIPYIHAPNLDVNIIKFMYWLGLGVKLFRGADTALLESHQSGKRSAPGTAYRIAEILGIEKENITSIRDPEKQRLLDIGNIGRHAFHSVEIGDGDSKIILQTKIEGLLPYVKGLYRIIAGLPGLDPKNYEIEEFVSMGIL